MPAKTVFVVVAAEAERELEQLLGVGDVFGGDDAGDAEIDLREVVDRAFGGERLGGERVAGVVPLRGTRGGAAGCRSWCRCSGGWFAVFDHGDVRPFLRRVGACV